MKKRNVGGLTKYVFKRTGAEEIQILQLPSQFVEESGNHFTDTTAHIWAFAKGLKDNEALGLDGFLRYCRKNGDVFNISDVITLNTFKNFARYTLKSVAVGQGCYKVNDKGEKCFFCVYRQKKDGHIMGAWLPYNEEIKALLQVKTITQDEARERQEKREKAMLEKLMAKYKD